MNLTPPLVLIVDDEAGIRLSLRGILEDEGCRVEDAASAEQALEFLASADDTPNSSRIADASFPDLVILDIWLPGMDGLTALAEIKKTYPDLPVVMISGHGTIETALNALRLGAQDFIEKPLELEKIVHQVRQALEIRELKSENRALREALTQPDKEGEEITGQSPAMQAFMADLARVAPTNAWVLVRGENGTGKELAARAIHRQSSRKNGPFVALNCAAIPEELIESELFGHEKGAFTGAAAQRQGKFELAHKGTLFLDEIGDMSLKTQAKILRILQEQRFERVGGSRTLEVDVRVVAATNKNLEKAIEEGQFRQDLFYRLNVFPLIVPPLRERAGDIPLLIEVLARRLERTRGAHCPRFSQAALDTLALWPWPGNVRELIHFVERMAVLLPKGYVEEEDLPLEMRLNATQNQIPFSMLTTESGCHTAAFTTDTGMDDAEQMDIVGGFSPSFAASSFNAEAFLAPDIDYKTARNAFEMWYLQVKLDLAGGNITRLAENVGLERSYVHKKLKGKR